MTFFNILVINKMSSKSLFQTPVQVNVNHFLIQKATVQCFCMKLENTYRNIKIPHRLASDGYLVYNAKLKIAVFSEKSWFSTV